MSDSDRPSLRDRVMPVVDAWRPLAVVGVAWLVVVTVVGLLLVGPLDDSGIVRTDLAIERWLVEHRTTTLDALAEAGTWLAETITVPIVLLVAIAVAWRVSANVAAPAFLAVAVGGEKLIYLMSGATARLSRPWGRRTPRRASRRGTWRRRSRFTGLSPSSRPANARMQPEPSRSSSSAPSRQRWKSAACTAASTTCRTAWPER